MKKPDDCTGIEDVRATIDVLDREILHLLGRRARYVATAARFKTDEEGVRAPERRKNMLNQRRRWAREEDLDPDFVESLYESIVSHFVQREMEGWKKDQA